MERCAQSGCPREGKWRPTITVPDGSKTTSFVLPDAVCDRHKQIAVARLLATKLGHRLETLARRAGIQDLDWSKATIRFTPILSA